MHKKKAYVIRGIAGDENDKLCDRVVSRCGWTTKREAERALKRGEHDECFNPYIATCQVLA